MTTLKEGFAKIKRKKKYPQSKGDAEAFTEMKPKKRKSKRPSFKNVESDQGWMDRQEKGGW